MQKEGIDTILRQNNEGLVYGLTFVDHKTKSVFNGSSIGKEYSAKGLQNKCDTNQMTSCLEGKKITLSYQELAEIFQQHINLMQGNEITKLIDLLSRAENSYEYFVKHYKSRKRKK